MDFTTIPLIVIMCYLCGEVFKFLFKTKQESYKLIPIITSVFGAMIAVIMYLDDAGKILS